MLVIALLVMTKSVYAQYIKLDNGLIFSSFNNRDKLPFLDSKISRYSFLLGSDYLEKRWFYLSSQIGYMQVGGKETNPALPEEFRNVSENRNYIHLNTTFRAYINTSGLKVFGGIGPYVNVLTGSKNFNSEAYKPFYIFKELNAGGKVELGATEDINKFRLGVVGTYLHSLTPTATSNYLSLKNNAFSVMITAGYRIR